MKTQILFLLLLICFSTESSLKFNFQDLMNDSPISFPQKDGILILTSETFDEAIKTYPHIAILFYATWCPHCKALYPEMVSALKTKEVQKMGLVFGRVDIEFQEKVREEYKINGMPTVIYFENGQKKEYYGGARNKNGIVEWFYKRLISKTHSITSLNDIKEYEKTKSHKFIYFGNDDKKIEEYEKFAKEHDSIIFGLCKDKKIIKSYNKNPETVVLFKPFDDPNYVDIKNITVENLKETLKLNENPLLYYDGNELMQKVFRMRKPAFFVFRNKNDTKFTPELDKFYKKLATKNRGKILFAISDFHDEFATRMFKFANVTKYNIEKNEPTAVILDFNKGFNKWRFENFFDKFSKENLEQFLNDWLNKKIVPPIKSEEIPEKQEGPVYKLVNKSFKKEVMDNDLDVFVKYYSPTCPHCVKLAPIYVELAERLKDNKNLRIAEFDLKSNDFDDFQIRGFPTLVFFKAGDKKNHIVYKGNRTVEDMMGFVLSNLGYPELEKKRKEEAAKKAKEEAERKKIEEEKRKKEEEERRKKAEEEARKKREEEARKKREEEARKKREEEARKKKEEEARKKREEEEKKKKEEEAKKRKAEEEAKKKKEEEEKRRKAKEEESKRKEAEEKSKKEEI